jgi:hypothetical protein
VAGGFSKPKTIDAACEVPDVSTDQSVVTARTIIRHRVRLGLV